ncbi:glycoside hydrolase family 47 protein [Flagelloscypha sp. PMI_526]|nr:glycoside hydrolase family 47 protein [Flagelloscypha sp. PMI_526]
MSNNYRRLDTGDSPSSLMAIYQRNPLSRLWQLYAHKSYVRLSLYGFLSLCTISLLYNMFGTSTPAGPAIPYPPEHFEDANLEPPHVWKDRADKVRQAFIHAYRGYEYNAFGHDELRPLSNKAKDNFNGWGVTIYDSLDTLILLGMDQEYETALRHVEKATFPMPTSEFVPFFETVIRHLGGLLSANALRPNDMLVQKADLLAQRLDGVFNTDSGLPWFGINPENNTTLGSEIGVLAEIASLQLEYTYLAKVTKNKKWYDRARNINRRLYEGNVRDTNGFLPIGWNLSTGQPHDSESCCLLLIHVLNYLIAIISVGAQADSAHEYLLKQYLLTGRTEKASLEMYIRATTHIITNLLYLSPTRHLLYVTDTRGPTSSAVSFPSHIFEHLSCFLPGLLALGAHLLPLDNLSSLGIDLEQLGNEKLFGLSGKAYRQLKSYNLKELHMWVANGLAETCYITYADMPSGLGPDEMIFQTHYADKSKNPVLWFQALQSWKSSGARGIPPGVGTKKPVVYSLDEVRSGLGRGRDYSIRKTAYLLRPETLESIYFMWKTTGEARWRERGWEIFKSIVKQTWTESGFASIRTVETSPAPMIDDMPSYFYAETLKYLWLMFTDTDPIPIDSWIFNTEAHPYPRIDWTAEERKLFGI